MPFEAVKVTGLRETNRAFSRLKLGLKDELRGDLLRLAVEPVRIRAEQRAGSGHPITHLHAGDRWAKVRSGFSARQGIAYIVPFARSRSRKKGRGRPNLGVMLLDQYEAAAFERGPEIVRGIERTLGNLAREEGF